MLKDRFIKERTVFSRHYGFGYFRNGNMYLMQINPEERTIRGFNDRQFREDCYKTQDCFLNEWSEWKMPCEEIYKNWKRYKKDIISKLNVVGENHAAETYALVIDFVPEEYKSEVRALIDKYYKRLSVEFYEGIRQECESKICRKRFYKERLKQAKTKTDKKYYQKILWSLY